jgi:CubicO group peptidase (beta-lactamase class C family)
LITLAGIKWTRTQLIEIFKNFPPNYLFRDTFEYNNYGFVTAGVVLEQLTGEKWEDFVQKEIFDKLNMQTSSTSVNHSINTGNYAVILQLIFNTSLLVSLWIK